MKAFIFHAEAKAEMIASAQFYETQSEGVGRRFLGEIDRALSVIADSPQAGRAGTKKRTQPRIIPHDQAATKTEAKRKGREVHAKNAKRFLRARCELFARLAVTLLKHYLKNFAERAPGLYHRLTPILHQKNL